MSDSIPGDGSVYFFRTLPYSQFASPVTNRYAALKALGSDESCVVVAVLDSIWSEPPSLNNVRDCALLRQYRFSHRGSVAVWRVNTEWWDLSDLAEMTLLGEIPLSDEELRFASNYLNNLPGTVISTILYANHAAEGEWRWANDRETLVVEQDQVELQQNAKRAAQEQRLKNRLRGLTWEQLLEETPFERWSPSPPLSARRIHSNGARCYSQYLSCVVCTGQ